MQILIYPMLVGIFGFIYLVFLPVMALMGQFVASMLSHNITFQQASRLIAIATTAPLCILLVLLATSRAYGVGIYMLILLIVYFCIGVIALKNDSKRIARI